MTNNDVKCGNHVFNVYQVGTLKGQDLADLQHTKNTTGYGTCKCNLRVQIRTLGERFHFAVWPQEGQLHLDQCFFSRNSIDSREKEWASLNAVVIHDDGLIEIKPAFSLARRIDEPRPTAVISRGKATKPTKRSASLSSLLEFLWMRSSNNKWFGHARPLGKAMYHVYEVAKVCKVGRNDLTEILHLAGSQRFPVEAFKRSLAPNDSRIPSGLILGQVVAIPTTPGGYMLQIKDLGASLYMTVDQEKLLNTSYPRAFSVHDYGENVIALAQVELTKSNDFKLISCAILITSRDFLPVDSSYESQLCNKLVDEERLFYKPMSVVDDLLPDFVLQDTGVDTALEVWGMLTEEYRVHMADKIERYRKQNKQLWQWDAALKHPIPALPPTV